MILKTKRVGSFGLLLALLSTLFLSAACKRHGQPRSSEQQQPQRIVSLSPSVTEILYGIGAWPQVVAVSQFCSYPEDVKNKPRVSGWDKTNLEQLMELKPDLVIGVESQEPFLRDKLDELGVRALFVTSQSLAQVFLAIEDIGRASGHEQEAKDLSTRTRGELDA